LNTPNIITIFRILLVPIFILTFSTPSVVHSYWAALIFVMASISDWLDGYFARRWKQVTQYGKLLDPIADKLLILSALVMLVGYNRIPAWIAIVLIGRDVAITGLRALASSSGIIIPAHEMGKYKTTTQIIAIILLIINSHVTINGMSVDLHRIGTIILWIAAILALVSGADYFRKFWGNIRRPTDPTGR